MKYLSINKENNDFGFKDSNINQILESDVEISDKFYNQFFEYQSQGKQFKIKDIKGEIFEEIFEEVIPEIKVPEPQKPNIQEIINSKMTKDMAILEGKLLEQTKMNSEMATKLAVLENKNNTNILEKEGEHCDQKIYMVLFQSFCTY